MRLEPLDEFTKKRLGVKDYTLISDESWSSYRRFFEVYHDENELFNIEKITVNKSTGEADYDSALYLTVEEAKALLIPLQKFIEQCNNE
jgi:hypothetical protein